MRTEAQQAEIDAYEFYFTFPDPQQNISMDVPIGDGPQCVFRGSSALLGQSLFHCSVRRIWGRLHFTCHVCD